jgi:CRISPR-associated protein Csx16
LADVLERIRRDMVEPLLGAADHLANDAGRRALVGLAQLYRDMGRWAEAAAVVREGWITGFSDPAAAFGKRGADGLGIDDLARRAAEERWKAEGTGRDLAEVRNDIEHAGFRSRPLPAATLQKRIRGLVEDFVLSQPTPGCDKESVHPPILVNLSNHPSGEWGASQREAALLCAPEIRDWPFPEVSPEADAAEIERLAEEIVADLMQAVPGATHVMVQGEFTLAHWLVRELQARGVICLAATTRREVLENAGGLKTTRFEFVRFREYG